MNELCIIPCGNRKIWDQAPGTGSVPAKEAYTGTFHKLCRLYADHFFTKAVILSAKHGFLEGDDVVPGPYDLSFSMRSSDVISTEILRNQIEDKNLDNYKRYVVLTGKKYIPVLDKAAPPDCELVFPLIGLKGIGYMQRELKYAVQSGEALHVKKEPFKRRFI